MDRYPSTAISSKTRGETVRLLQMDAGTYRSDMFSRSATPVRSRLRTAGPLARSTQVVLTAYCSGYTTVNTTTSLILSIARPLGEEPTAVKMRRFAFGLADHVRSLPQPSWPRARCPAFSRQRRPSHPGAQPRCRRAVRSPRHPGARRLGLDPERRRGRAGPRCRRGIPRCGQGHRLDGASHRLRDVLPPDGGGGIWSPRRLWPPAASTPRPSPPTTTRGHRSPLRPPAARQYDGSWLPVEHWQLRRPRQRQRSMDQLGLRPRPGERRPGRAGRVRDRRGPNRHQPRPTPATPSTHQAPRWPSTPSGDPERALPWIVPCRNRTRSRPRAHGSWQSGSVPP